jgi:hypothetical protein
LKLFLIFIFSGVSIYFLFKLGLYIYRPFYLEKVVREIQSKFDNFQALLDKDIETAVENFEKWQSGDKAMRFHYNEDGIREKISKAQSLKRHEQEVNEKFIRLRERYIHNYKILAEAIIYYKKYLDVRLKQYTNASVFVNALTCGAITFEEFTASAFETKIVVDESEKQLDDLLEGKGKLLF